MMRYASRFQVVGVLDTYVVYIGFDTEAKPEKKSKTRRVRTSKAQR